MPHGSSAMSSEAPVHFSKGAAQSNLSVYEAELEKLTLKEERIQAELRNLMEQKNVLSTRTENMRNMLPNLHVVETDVRQLAQMIDFATILAENVSSKVRQIDMAQTRVANCLQRVDDILDVKLCAEGVRTALENEDFEQAAAHVHRYLALDENALKRTAKDVVEGSQLDDSFFQLHEAEARLSRLVAERFDQAVEARDVASVERFFKIFPLLNKHDSGLTKFGKYLCMQIGEKASVVVQSLPSSGGTQRKNHLVYADALTAIFEDIAQVIEVHQPLIETYYGPGYILRVIKQLKGDCDRFAVQVINHFERARDLPQRARTIRQLQNNESSTAYKNTERMDPKELDSLLAEISMLNSRAALYERFLRRRLMNDVEFVAQDNLWKERAAEVELLLKNCELSQRLQELLGCYIGLEEYFIKESVKKAVSMDDSSTESDDKLRGESNAAIILNGQPSPMVDDVFFIVKKTVRRALSGANIDGLCAVINISSTTLELHFCKVLEDRIKTGFPSSMLDLSQAYSVIQTSIQQGRYQTTDAEKMKIVLATLNNAEAASDYTTALKANIEDEIKRHLTQVSTSSDHAKIDSCLGLLSTVSTKCKSIVEQGVKQLVSSGIKSRIKSWVNVFQSVNHDITEDEFSHYEANDPFVQQLIVNADAMLTTYKNQVSGGIYEALIGQISMELAVQLENVILKSDFNRLGGLQLDKELRSIIGYLSGVSMVPIRDKFTRVSQIASILNLEKVSEVTEYWNPNSSRIAWRLTPKEVREILKRRKDFQDEDIRRVKLQ